MSTAVVETSHVDSNWLAKRYGVVPETITKLARTGEIPGLKLGTDWRFDPKAVQQALENRSPFYSKQKEEP